MEPFLVFSAAFIRQHFIMHSDIVITKKIWHSIHGSNILTSFASNRSHITKYFFSHEAMAQILIHTFSKPKKKKYIHICISSIKGAKDLTKFYSNNSRSFITIVKQFIYLFFCSHFEINLPVIIHLVQCFDIRSINR